MAFLIPLTIIILLSGCHRNLSKAALDEKDPVLKTSETSLTDIDGNTYPVVKIGKQLWMGANLRVSKYHNGEPISASSGMSSLQQTQSGAFVWYDNKESNDKTYGKLYNFKAVLEGNLCPEGWHVPSDEDWQQLILSVGKDENLLNAFNIQKSGFFNPQDISPFSDAGKAAYWWSSATVGRNTAASYNFQFDASNIERSGANEMTFYAVRCMKD